MKEKHVLVETFFHEGKYLLVETSFIEEKYSLMKEKYLLHEGKMQKVIGLSLKIIVN